MVTVRLLGRLLIRCYQRLCLLVPDGYIVARKLSDYGRYMIAQESFEQEHILA